MFADLEEGVLLAFVEAERLAWNNPEAGEAAYADYHRARCREAMRDLRARRKPIAMHSVRRCKWCRLEFTVVLHGQRGRKKEYCCSQHENAAAQFRHRERVREKALRS